MVSKEKPNKLDHIQILRGISVAIVVLYHFFPNTFPGGFVGVDLFFVISGFVITKSLFAKDTMKILSLPVFYRHRLFRIVPGYLTVGLITLIIVYYLCLPEDLKNISKHLSSSILFLNNVILYKEVDYFDIGAETKPLLHYWSLSVEEQFYIIYPVLLVIAYSKRRDHREIIKLIIILTILSLIYYFIASAWDKSFAFYMMPTRFWELSIGGILYFTSWDRLGKESEKKSVIIILTIAIFFLSFVKLDSTSIQSLAAVLIALLYLSCARYAIRKGENFSNILIPFRNLGEISYSLYLTHWPIYSISYLIYQGEIAIIQKLILVFISIILAIMIYFTVERPMIRIGREEQRGREYLTKETMLLLSTMSLIFAVSAYIYSSKGLEIFADGDKFKLSKAGHWSHQFSHCDRSATPVFKIDSSCTFNYQKFSKNFIIIGDSHADHFFIGLANAGSAHGYGSVHAGSNGCPPLLGVNRVERTRCLDYLNSLLDYIKNDSKIEIVIIAARWAYYIQGKTAPGEPVGVVNFQNEYFSESVENKLAVRRGLEKLIHRLRTYGKRVVIIDQIPEFKIDPRKYQYYRNKNLIVREDEFRERRTDIIKDVVDIMSSTDIDIQYYDPLYFFCKNNQCTANIKDNFIYRDDDHLNELGSNILGEEIFKKIILNK
jgi:peptidoglycan/LPS O-acetylase OafA/YrhL